MGSVFGDLQLALSLIAFIFLFKWSVSFTDSVLLGGLLALAVAYLTFFSHFEMLILVLLFFFGAPLFSGIIAGLTTPLYANSYVYSSF